MNNKSTDAPIEHNRKKTRFSIVFRLNARLFFWLLGIFFALDFFLITATAIGMTYLAEETAATAASVINQSGLPEKNAQDWLTASKLYVTPVEGDLKGWVPPESMQNFLPKLTAPGARSFGIQRISDTSMLRILDGLVYHINIKLNGSAYDISMELGPAIIISRRIFFILLIIQFLMLLSGLFKGARNIRETLRPIYDLAETAHNLNDSRSFTPEEMEALAGKLEGINAARLDTRISLDDTQDELKYLAHAINGMLDRINASYRSQIRFVSDASHELRTPISVIQGYANLLDRWGKNDEKALQESIDAIKDEAASMKILVEKLLFLARGDNNTMVLQMESFDLSEIASEVLRETQMIDSEHEYSSRFETAFVLADQALIKQALRILVDNAIKYTNPGGHIILSVSREANFAKLMVQDNGIGIPSESVPRIFDRFFRADESRARATGGTGLGLSIAGWITQRHGGHIEVLSREGIGTRITIVLPAVSSDQ